MEIGQHVLGKASIKSDKRWFRQVLPLLQTCTQLREQLRPLLSTPLLCEVTISIDRLEVEALEGLAKWRKYGPYQGQDILIINYMCSQGLKLSPAAAFAGALECAIHGSLLREPTVYFQCVTVFIPGRGGGKYYISHRGEKNMVGEALNFQKCRSFRYVNLDEAVAVWVKARKEGKLY